MISTGYKMQQYGDAPISRSPLTKDDSRIVFVDFDGTICKDRFWAHLPAPEYTKIQKSLFYDQAEFVNDWMRGKHTARDACHLVALATGLDEIYVYDELILSCKNFNIDPLIFRRLKKLRKNDIVVLSTSNMDCFDAVIDNLQLQNYFDKIVSSFNVGMLKTDNEGEFFEQIALAYGASIERCVLIDDSAEVCEIFARKGGLAHRVLGEQDAHRFLASPHVPHLALPF